MSSIPVTVKPSEADIRLIEDVRRLARELSPTEVAELRARMVLSSQLDYSKYVTLVRNQDGYGGCGMMTSLAILDILKERERPFSPDASSKFAGYVYNAAKYWRESHPDWEPDPRVPYDPNVDQLKVLQQFGCCSEASYPTNYDASSVTPDQPPPKEEWPSDANFAEAKLYHIGAFGLGNAVKKPSVEVLKVLLHEHGPLPMLELYKRHVLTLIGYDDNRVADDGNTGVFIALNSWGDQWGTNGMVIFSYHMYNTLLSQQDITVGWVDNSPTPPYVYPYTARVRIHHHDRRNRLKVSIGITGHNPVVVWDRPQVRVMADDSKNLTLDVPLPSYAQGCWPPSEDHRWYVQVQDYGPSSTSPNDIVGEVKEIALVYRRMLTPTHCIPVIYRASSANIPIVSGDLTEIYVPAKKHYTLNLAVDHTQVSSGNSVLFNGTFFLRYVVSNRLEAAIPQPNHEVIIRAMEHDRVEGDIPIKTIGTTTTDQRGHYTLEHSPTETADYQAIVTQPDNIVIAISNSLKVSV